MPSITHEGLLQPFDHRPELAAELLTDPLGVALPVWHHARLAPADLTELVPTEFRADRTIELVNTKEKPVLGVVLEAQLGRKSRKRFAWPAYVGNLHARLRCPIVLLVISPRAQIAAWCAKPILVGPGTVTTPVVLGPAQLPVVTDVDLARSSPDLAALSALAHGGLHPDRNQVLAAFLEALGALRTVDVDRAELYHDVVCAVLPVAARGFLEELMSVTTWKFRSDFAIRHRREGEALGRAKAVLAVLGARGVDVPKDARDRITGCSDFRELNIWARRAARANTIDDLFTKK